MVTGAAALQVASGLRSIDQAKNIVNALPATELSRRNREALRQMRVPDSVADRYLQNPLLSPRHQTVIVEAMKTLRGIPAARLLFNTRREPTAKMPLCCFNKWWNSSPTTIDR